MGRAAAITEMEQVPSEVVGSVLDEFHKIAVAHGHVKRGGFGYARQEDKGRVGIHELLTATDEMKRLIQKKSTVENMRNQALKDGMRTLLQDGLMKAVNGVPVGICSMPVPFQKAAVKALKEGWDFVEEMRQVTERIIGIPATRFQGLSAKQIQLVRDMIQDIEAQLAEWRSIIGSS